MEEKREEKLKLLAETVQHFNKGILIEVMRDVRSPTCVNWMLKLVATLNVLSRLQAKPEDTKIVRISLQN
jgi:hypothetical protein